MYNKTKILTILIIALILFNIFLTYNLYKVNNEVKNRKLISLSHADIGIDNAVQYISQLNDEWYDISDAEKMKYLGDAQSELTKAIELMAASDNFFQPVKIYRSSIFVIENKILEQVDSAIQKDYVEGLYNDFLILWKFLANNKISEMTYEHVRQQWKSVVVNLKTKEIYEYLY